MHAIGRVEERITSTRGQSLIAFAIVTAAIASISSYAALFMVKAGASQKAISGAQSVAHYAAEAGIVLARERLQQDPAYCGSTEFVDTDADGTPETAVVIAVTACGASNPHEIKATVTF